MRKKRRSVRTKALIMLLSVITIIGGTFGGSLAWLVDTSPAVTNVFTVGKVQVRTEMPASTFSLRGDRDDSLRMVPGWELTIQDPAVIVEAGSEACYLFMKIDEDAGSFYTDAQIGFRDYLNYAVTEGWTLLAGDGVNPVPPNVYYRVVERSDIDQAFNLIHEKKVKVSEHITSEMMSALTQPGAALPTLTFSAYAVQLYSGNDVTFSPAEAWAKISDPSGLDTAESTSPGETPIFDVNA
ncbi:MAG: hypothetical protein IKD37_04985 [Clostridia bacterium]|nr:hypothetical protein [Clostridia bacterium]